jgi:hypothetical protein
VFTVNPYGEADVRSDLGGRVRVAEDKSGVQA